MSDDTTQATRGLNTVQLDYLLRPLDGSRVKQAQGQSHLEAWDVRRWLNRIFGIGGWSYTTTAELVRELENPAQAGGRSRWTIVYRAKVRLEVRDPAGNTLAFFEEYAVGDAQNQPSIGDAHDQAVKTAESQALKRCAVNLGDQFGLSLYDSGGQNDGNGHVRAVVQRTLDIPPAPAAEAAPAGSAEQAEETAA